MRLRTALSVPVAALAAALTLTVPGAAHAAPAQTAVPLPITWAEDVVSSGPRVFVSSGVSGADIVVTDRSGAVTGTIGGLPGPADLQLSNDRRTLYVALAAGDAIAAFDTTTLAEVARFDTAAAGAGCPFTLALTGGNLWFGFGCEGRHGGIGRVDLGQRPAVVSTAVLGEFYNPPLLTSGARNNTVLAAGKPGQSPAEALVYTIGAGGTLTLRNEAEWGEIGSNMRDLALDPTGTTLFLACGFPYAVNGYPADDIREDSVSATLPTGAYPNAVEPTRDGALIAAGIDGGSAPDVYIFRPGGTLVSSFELGARLADGALAWQPNGAHVYAVTSELWPGGDTPAVLHVLTV